MPALLHFTCVAVVFPVSVVVVITISYIHGATTEARDMLSTTIINPEIKGDNAFLITIIRGAFLKIMSLHQS